MGIYVSLDILPIRLGALDFVPMPLRQSYLMVPIVVIWKGLQRIGLQIPWEVRGNWSRRGYPMLPSKRIALFDFALLAVYRYIKMGFPCDISCVWDGVSHGIHSISFISGF